MNEKITIDKKEFIKAIQALGSGVKDKNLVADVFMSKFFDREIVYSYYDYLFKKSKYPVVHSRCATNKFIFYHIFENDVGVHRWSYGHDIVSEIQLELLLKIF